MKADLGSARRWIAAALAGATLLMLAPASAPAATINVGTEADEVDDDGMCSLREAVDASNENSGLPSLDCIAGDAGALDTIQLAPTATTYTLDETNNFMVGSENANVSGDLDVEGGTAGVRILGAGAAVTTINTTVMDRLIHVESGLATIEGVTVTGGSSNDGGGIANAGSLTLTNTTVSGNDASSRGGGIHQTGAGAATTLNGSTIGGSPISGNDAALEGGGFYLNAGTLTLNQSVVSGNSATRDDPANESPKGGGLYLNTGTATIDASSITGNDASTTDPDDSPFGGGIFNGGANLTITDSTLSGNTTFGGIGTSRQGGGIYHTGGLPLTIRNSTFSGNNADGSGGGLQNNFGNAELVHVTFNGNTAPVGGAMDYLDFPPPGGSLRLRGVLIANGASACNFEGGGAAITSDGYNIDQGNSCGLSTGTDVQNVANPMLDATLANNGGPTMTHALLGGSPAIDRVPNADCDDENGAPLTVDQRGFARPSPPGGSCDTGSFELTQTPVSTSPSPLPTTGSAVQAKESACAALRAKLKKAKSKKKKRKIRKQLRKLGC